jgi:ankyrin repeat protein
VNKPESKTHYNSVLAPCAFHVYLLEGKAHVANPQNVISNHYQTVAHPGRPIKSDPKVDHLRIDIQQGRIDVVKNILAEFGIDATDGDGRTALINAVICKNRELIDYLVDSGANVNHQDRIGYSALHFCAQEKLPAIADFLLTKNANPNLPDLHGNTPLWTAVMNSKTEIGVIQTLLRHGADPNIVNKHGKSAGQMFATIYNKDITEVLVV